MKLIMSVTGFMLALVLLCCTSGVLLGQESIGFSDPTDIRSILDYRLPSWGYTTFTLDFDALGSRRHYEARNRPVGIDHSYRLGFAPDFNRYSESEKDVTSLRFWFDVDWVHAESELRSLPYPDESDYRSLSFDFSNDAEWQHYFRPRRFYTLAGSFSGYYNENRQVWRYDGDREYGTREISKTYETTLRIGLGCGRLRYVTPVIRALRLNERLAALGKRDLVSQEDILGIAQQFAERSGYTEVYDRSDKYFWQDLFETIDGDQTLTPYEIYYVTDVLKEKPGARYEGWTVSSGLEFSHVVRQFKSGKLTMLACFVDGSWYRNVTLTHQLAFEGSAEYGVISSTGDPRDSDGQVQLAPLFLWVVNDRILWESRLDMTFDFGKAGRTPTDPREWFFDQEYDISTDFTFFVEDNLSLSTGMSFEWSRNDKRLWWTQRLDDWRWNLGLTYYVDRHLM